MEIPHEALPITSNSYGSMPVIGLHYRNQAYYQESSYSHFWSAGVMLVAAIVISFLPWQTIATDGIKLKYYIAVGCIWTAVCFFVPYFIRNALGQTIVINPRNKTLRIKANDLNQIIA